jgi:L-amino acid N-acyltransferase YncA
MELKYFESVASCGYAADIQALLEMADQEFIPPLSARGSSTQQNLTSAAAVSEGAKAYFEAMSAQPVVVAVENGRCCGFMAFKKDYVCEYYNKTPNLYASTCVVHPVARGKGLMRGFYQTMIDLFPNCSIYTRTWHTNIAHLKVLEKLGFSLLVQLPDHRGPGMDTVYYCKEI